MEVKSWTRIYFIDLDCMDNRLYTPTFGMELKFKCINNTRSYILSENILSENVRQSLIESNSSNIDATFKPDQYFQMIDQERPKHFHSGCLNSKLPTLYTHSDARPCSDWFYLSLKYTDSFEVRPFSTNHSTGQIRSVLWLVEIFVGIRNFRQTDFPTNCRAKVRSCES